MGLSDEKLVLPHPIAALSQPRRQPPFRCFCFAAVLETLLILRHQVRSESFAELLHVLTALVALEVLGESNFWIVTGMAHVDTNLVLFHVRILGQEFLIVSHGVVQLDYIHTRFRHCHRWDYAE